MRNITICLLLSVGCFANCIINKAGIDIGSGATKIKVARVNKCEKKVETILLDISFPVGYKSDLKKSKDNKFSKKIIKKGLGVLKKIKLILKGLSVKETLTVATSAFRTSENSFIIVNRAKKLGLDIKIITQKEEALLGYKAAKLLAGKNDYVVWDIGGGSMQISYKRNGRFLIYEGHLAAVPFRSYIIKEIQEKKARSPNPMSMEDAKLATSYSRSYADKDIPRKLKSILVNEKIDIIGIGGVHSKAILKAMNRSGYYTQDQLREFLRERIKLTDSDIGGQYASTSTSNLALVLGFMESLSIKKVIAGNVNLSDGLLLTF